MSQLLARLGLGAFFRRQIGPSDADLVPARIAADRGERHQLLGTRARWGKLSGRARSRQVRPVAGDWVLVREAEPAATIERVLERRTALARRAPGGGGRRQIIAANLDRAVVVTSANLELNMRRVERYLAAIWDSGALPAIALNKIDCVGEAERSRLVAALGELGDVPVVATSAVSGAGIEELAALVGDGETMALLGSSGVGKSSLANRLVGEERQAVGAVRAGDDKGRHTTTTRELFTLPGGGLLLDTPGMRELGVAELDEGIERAFAELDALAERCRFRDCAHASEPGCAVRAAVESGELAAERLASYRKLAAERG